MLSSPIAVVGEIFRVFVLLFQQLLEAIALWEV
jgi:hypothetical protein